MNEPRLLARLSGGPGGRDGSSDRKSRTPIPGAPSVSRQWRLSMSSKDRQRSSWMRLAGMGIELGAAVAGLALFGYWIDRHYGTAPKGLLIGATLGLVGGLYNLIRSSMALIRADQEARESPPPEEGREIEVDDAESARAANSRPPEE